MIEGGCATRPAQIMLVSAVTLDFPFSEVNVGLLNIYIFFLILNLFSCGIKIKRVAKIMMERSFLNDYVIQYFILEIVIMVPLELTLLISCTSDQRDIYMVNTPASKLN